MAFDCEVPRWRCLFSADGTRAIARHSLNRRVDVFLPSGSAAANAVADRLSRHFGYAAKGPLSALLSPDFLAAYVRDARRHFVAVSAAAAPNCSGGDDDAFALLPGGTLVLALSRATYQQLGIEGSVPPFARFGVAGSGGGCGGGAGRRFVRIDVAAKSFAPGRSLYDRVMWCLSPDRVGAESAFLACCVDAQSGAACDVAFPAAVRAERASLSVARTELRAAWQPSPVAVAKAAAATCSREQAAALFEWAGFAAVRSPLLAEPSLPPTLPLLAQDAVQRPCTCIAADGALIPSQLVADVAALAVGGGASDASDASWACTSCTGFEHSPVSWGTSEHDALLGGCHGVVAFSRASSATPFAFCYASPHDTFAV